MCNQLRELALWLIGIGCGVMLTFCIYAIAEPHQQTVELPIKGTVIETEVKRVTDNTYLLETYVKETE